MGRLGAIAATVAGAVALSAVTLRGTGTPVAAGADADLMEPSLPSTLPSDFDTLATLESVAAAAAECADECATVVYAWTPRMPLSRAGIPNVERAAQRSGVRLSIVAFEELADYAMRSDGDALALADGMLAAGALAHAPALVVTKRGSVTGPAILGYKTADAYEAAISRRLAEAEALSPAIGSSRLDLMGADETEAALLADYDVRGVPGAYFRWVPSRNAVAYESSHRIYLLDLADGRSRIAPGFIDFVPTPDGRYFVTPGEVEGGLTFYDAAQVFDAARTGRPGEAEPIFTDLRMRDQYPSVGILEQSPGLTRYRVMTSWFEGVVYRDYDVRVDPSSGVSSVQPAGEPLQPCVDVRLSTPIMSQDGSEVAGRDESTGTTKIFRMLEGGRCEAVTDFGVATSKVAWHSSGRKVAFSIPRRRRAGDEGEQGIFVLDRDGPTLTRVPTSEGASRLAFPDFVGEDAVVFLVPGASVQEPSMFRVVPLAP